MKQAMAYPGAAGGQVDLIGNPIKLSETPVDYRHAPPRMGADSDALLRELLDLEADEIASLRDRGVV